jgi:glycosyltransferase involved in cell wall biosynthesis
MEPSVSLIIRARNEEHNLRQTLTLTHELSVEVIVANDGSEDATAEVAHSRGAKVLVLPPLQPGGLRRLGSFSWATSVVHPVPWLAFVVISLRSFYLASARGQVPWKGRLVHAARSTAGGGG